MSENVNAPNRQLEWEWVKPVIVGIKWLNSLSREEIKVVRDECEQLLGHLSKGLVNLWKITRAVTSISDVQFQTDFPKTYEYFKEAYYDPVAFEAVRIHCAELIKDIKDITFKISVLLRSDLGRWHDAYEALQISLLEDVVYQAEYKQNFDTLNERLNEINALLINNEPTKALEKYKLLRKQLSGDLDYLNKHIETFRAADTRFREIVG